MLNNLFTVIWVFVAPSLSGIFATSNNRRFKTYIMSLKKQFLKSKPVCKVSFRLDASEALGANKVQLLGDFNNWGRISSANDSTKIK